MPILIRLCPPPILNPQYPPFLLLPPPPSAYLTFVALSRKDPEGGPPAKRTLPRVTPTDRHTAQIHSEAARRWVERGV